MSQAEVSPPNGPGLFQVIGANVRRLREERGWSQERLAVYSGMTRSTIAQVERGHSVQGRQIEAVVGALGVPWSEVVAAEGEVTRAYLDAIPPPFELIHGHGSGNGQRPLVRLAR